MLRLTFLLCSGLFLIMLLGGRDFGQLRPGLVQAGADAETRLETAEVPVVETIALASGAVTGVAAETQVLTPAVEPQPVILSAPAVSPRPVVVTAPASEAVSSPEPVVARAVAEQELAELGTPEPESTVFTLSNYADPVTAKPTAREPVVEDESEIWYVDGTSVNVRAGPSTDDAVVGKLSRGEATLLVSREDEEWARIRIEGDGIEGYVAVRFLTPQAPGLD